MKETTSKRSRSQYEQALFPQVDSSLQVSKFYVVDYSTRVYLVWPERGTTTPDTKIYFQLEVFDHFSLLGNQRLTPEDEERIEMQSRRAQYESL